MSASLPTGGVFAAPHDPAALGGLRRGVDTWRKIDLARVSGKDGLLKAFARALGFPAHFGHNWDALADALEDLGWLRWSALVIELENTERLRVDAAEDWSIALDILRNAAIFWGKQGKAFVAIVHGAVDLPRLDA